jgi:hypothetical protein
MIGPSKISDNGGTRSGKDRRQNSGTYRSIEKRSGKDRRKGLGHRRGARIQKIPVNKKDRAIEHREIFRFIGKGAIYLVRLGIRSF